MGILLLEYTSDTYCQFTTPSQSTCHNSTEHALLMNWGRRNW